VPCATGTLGGVELGSGIEAAEAAAPCGMEVATKVGVHAHYLRLGTTMRFTYVATIAGGLT
jgi:hypothetical protein